jgi:hypothetical protein
MQPARLHLLASALLALTACSSRPAVLIDAAVTNDTGVDQGGQETSLPDAFPDASSCVNTAQAKSHWVTLATNHGSLGYITATDMALDKAGQLYVAGYFIGNATFGATTFKGTAVNQRYYFIAKLSASGSYLWARSIPLKSWTTRKISLAVNAAGEIWAAGTYEGSITFGSTTLKAAGGSDVFLVKLSPAGGYLQTLSSSGAGDEFAEGLDIDASGSIYLAGAYRKGTATFGATTLSAGGKGRLFLARIKPDGNYEWVIDGGGVNSRINSKGLTIDAADGVLIAGHFADTVQFGATTLVAKGSCGDFLNSDLFVTKVTADGKYAWALQIRSKDACGESISAVLADGVGGALVMGRMPGAGVFGAKEVPDTSKHKFFFAEVSSAGKVGWVSYTTSAQALSLRGAVKVGASSLLLAGNFEEGVTFGSTTLCSRGDREIFVARFDLTKRAYTWAFSAGGPQSDDGELIDADSAGRLYVAGNVGDNAVLGGLTIKDYAPVYLWCLTPL